MSSRKHLTIPQVAVLDAILERGHNYEGVRALLPNLLEDDIRSESGLKSSALTGSKCLKRIFNFIKEDGTLLGDSREFIPFCEKRFLQNVKKYPGGILDIENKLTLFLGKSTKR